MILSFQFNNNLLESWNDLDQLKKTETLTTIYVEGNPLAKDVNYRRKVKLTLPFIKQIDATLTG
jgi:protein phosphatase 1 regulatory subunit 7